MNDGGGRKRTVVFTREWDRGIVNAAVDQFTPLHVIEEESLLSILVVYLAKSDRSAGVEAVGVKPQFRSLASGRVCEIVARIQSVVADELPCRGVEIFFA